MCADLVILHDYRERKAHEIFFCKAKIVKIYRGFFGRKDREIISALRVKFAARGVHALFDDVLILDEKVCDIAFLRIYFDDHDEIFVVKFVGFVFFDFEILSDDVVVFLAAF